MNGVRFPHPIPTGHENVYPGENNIIRDVSYIGANALLQMTEYTPPDVIYAGENNVVFGHQAGTSLTTYADCVSVGDFPELLTGPFTWVRRGRGWIAYRTEKES